MADGGRCRRVTSAGGQDLELGDVEDWQAVLNRAARIKRLRQLEDGSWLHQVEDSGGAVALYAVEAGPTG